MERESLLRIHEDRCGRRNPAAVAGLTGTFLMSVADSDALREVRAA